MWPCLNGVVNSRIYSPNIFQENTKIVSIHAEAQWSGAVSGPLTTAVHTNDLCQRETWRMTVTLSETVCYSSSLITPSNPLFSCCALWLFCQTPLFSFDSSINLYLTLLFFHLSLLTHFSPTTSELFLMHFVSHSCSVYVGTNRCRTDLLSFRPHLHGFGEKAKM